jgi:GTP cyclohydrolase IA
VSAEYRISPDYSVDPLARIARQLLVEIGEDPDREGLRETPDRFARWWREFIDYEPGSTGTLFESVGSNQVVVVEDMSVWSLCEHHLLPFSCSITIAYKPAKSILGLSKFARIAERYAHKLQVQERLVEEIGREVSMLSGSADVAVVGKGEHLCMAMRGVKSTATMTTTAFRGVFSTDPRARSELFELLRR